jgi:hypothetical protein
MAYVSQKRDCFEEYGSRAKEKSHIDGYQNAYKRVRQCSSTIVFFLDGRSNTNEVLQGSGKFKIETYIPFIDSLVNKLEKRSKECEEIFERFGFLERLRVLDRCEKLANFYNKDLNSEELTSECHHFKSYIKLGMKSLIELKNVGEDAAKEECINIHKYIGSYAYNEKISSIFPSVKLQCQFFFL